MGAVGLGLALLLGVGLDTGQELLTGAGVTDVLDADVDALLDVTVADLAVEDGTVGDDIDDISDLVLLEVGREGDVTLERC